MGDEPAADADEVMALYRTLSPDGRASVRSMVEALAQLAALHRSLTEFANKIDPAGADA